MTSTITLYKNTGLKPGKNYLFEDASDGDFLDWLSENYLGASQEVQYQKIAPSLSIRLTLGQEKYFDSMYDYASIPHTITKGLRSFTFYLFYFVTSCTWRAQNTIELSLTLDVLNTFRTQILSDFTAKTHITRQHKDRFASVTYRNSNYYLQKNVNPYPEGITPTLKLKSKQSITAYGESASQKYYLIYATANNLEVDNITNPVSVYLSAKEKITLESGVSNPVRIMSATEFQRGVTYYFLPTDNNAQMSVIGRTIGTLTPGEFLNVTYDPSDTDTLFYFMGFNITVGGYTYGLYFGKVTRTGIESIYDNLGFVQDEHAEFEFTAMIKARYGGVDPYIQISDILELPVLMINSGVISDVNIEPFSDTIDRTDSRLMKIIEIPYAPTDLDFESVEDIGGGLWKWSNGLLKLNSLNSSFLLRNFASLSLATYVIESFASTPSTSNSRFIEDPKLQSSQFSTHSFVYDSFAKDISLDNIVYSTTTTAPTINVSFKMNNSLASSFAFKLDPVACSLEENENFSRYLVVDRNNELPIFSSGYVDYIRSGYNYDLKSKATARTQQFAGLIASGASTAIMASLVSANPIATAGVGVVTAIASLVSIVASERQAQDNIDRKLKELSMQGASVSGSTDVETMGYYSDNKLWHFYYEPSEPVKKSLDDLFYYYGYACNEYGIPDLHSRALFNFVQCEPVFAKTESTIYSMISDYFSEIEERFKAGVTIFHPIEENEAVFYDYAQERENWETSVLEAV